MEWSGLMALGLAERVKGRGEVGDGFWVLGTTPFTFNFSFDVIKVQTFIQSDLYVWNVVG